MHACMCTECINAAPADKAVAAGAAVGQRGQGLRGWPGGTAWCVLGILSCACIILYPQKLILKNIQSYSLCIFFSVHWVSN